MKIFLFAGILLSTSAAMALPGYFDVNLDHGEAAVAALRLGAQENQNIDRFVSFLEEYIVGARRPDPATRQFEIAEYDPEVVYAAMMAAIRECDQELDECGNLKAWPDKELFVESTGIEDALWQYMAAYNAKLKNSSITLDEFTERFNFHYEILEARRVASAELYIQFCNRYGLERKMPVETFVLQALVNRDGEENKSLFDNGYGRTTYKMDGSYDTRTIITFDNYQEILARRKLPNCELSAAERTIIFETLLHTGFIDLADDYGEVFDADTCAFTYSLRHQVKNFIQKNGPIEELALADGNMLSRGTQTILGFKHNELEQGFGMRYFGHEDLAANVMRVDMQADAMPDVVGDMHNADLYLTLSDLQGTVSKIVDRSAGCYVTSNPETMNLIQLLLGDEGVFEVWAQNSFMLDQIARPLSQYGFVKIGEDPEFGTATYRVARGVE